jgi:hypothetical protein
MVIQSAIEQIIHDVCRKPRCLRSVLGAPGVGLFLFAWAAQQPRQMPLSFDLTRSFSAVNSSTRSGMVGSSRLVVGIVWGLGGSSDIAFFTWQSFRSSTEASDLHDAANAATLGWKAKALRTIIDRETNFDIETGLSVNATILLINSLPVQLFGRSRL